VEQLAEQLAPASVRRKPPLTAHAAAAYALWLEEDLTTQHTRQTDVVAWGAELEQLRAQRT
jgi:hypothetical protein